MSNEENISQAEAVSPKTEAIRKFSEAGFALIPLKGKIPVTRNWASTPVGRYTEKDLAAGNYGVVIPDGILVVDIDPRNFKKGDRPVSRLLEAIGSDLKSFTQKTGGGGVHIFLTIPPGTRVVNSLKEYPGIEFKAAGRQVVGAGSIHPDSGQAYAIAYGSPSEISKAPEKLLGMILAGAVTKSDSEVDAGSYTYKRDEGTTGRFTSYLTGTAEPSVQGQNGDANAFRVAAYARDLGLPPDIALELMITHWNPRCQPPWEESELRTKVINAYKYATGTAGGAHPESDFTPLPPSPPKPITDADIPWDTTPQGGIKVNFNNLLNHLRAPSTGLNNLFGFNDFLGRPEFIRPAPWHKGIMPKFPAVGDNDLKHLKAYLATRHHFEMGVASLEEAVLVVSFEKRFHPVRDYLSGLKWDGVPRLDNWLRDFCGAPDDAYTRACARKVLCAAVMRVFKPGVKFDHALVLEGDQGIGKSSICSILGGEWAGDFPIDPHNKDTIQLLQGRWIIELAELEVTRRADNDALKAFISRQVDTARLAYGRTTNEFPRQSIFVASKNVGSDGTYLKDDTGNRRWWPVRLDPKGGFVDFKGLKAVRDQLFAEAVQVVGKGERLDMDTPELREAAKASAAARYTEHEWTERISAWVHGLPDAKEFLTGRDIFVDAMGGVDKQFDRKSATAIASIMRTLGWTRVVRRIGPRLVKGYQRPVDNAAVEDLI